MSADVTTANAPLTAHLDSQRDAEAAMRQRLTARERELAQIDATWGDGQIYERDRVVDATRFFLEQSAGAMLEAGRRLVWLRERESHGAWSECLTRIGLAPRAAQKFMQAAMKYSGGARQALAGRLDRTKLLELVAEDNEDLDALADGGTVAGLTLDEVDRMTARDLRVALRTARDAERDQQQLQDRLLADKDAKINDLHKRLMKAEQRSLLGDQQAELDAAEVGRDIALSTQRVLDALFGVERLVLALSERELPVHLGEALAGNLQRITDHLDRVREIGAAVIPDDGGPDDAGWVRELADDDVSGGAA